MVLAFVPMYCVAVGYRELNDAEPDAGTTFTWAARAFGPRTGWMGGWGIVAADVIVMANLAAVAGSYLDHAHDLHLLPRYRGLCATPVRPARRGTRRPRVVRDRRPSERAYKERRTRERSPRRCPTSG